MTRKQNLTAEVFGEQWLRKRHKSKGEVSALCTAKGNIKMTSIDHGYDSWV